MSAASVVLLGTGSPRPSPDRAQPAQLVEFGADRFLVDCGDGVTTQLQRAGYDPGSVTKLFITHLHWDHVLGYAPLVWGGWSLGRRSLEVWGPPGTRRMHETLFEDLYRPDVEWIRQYGYPRSGIDDIKVREVGEGRIYDRDGVRVDAVRVSHPVITYAYRFSSGGATIVFSGDTAECDELVRCAHGADLLVQDACACRSRLYDDARSKRIRDALIGFHASPEQAGRMAQRAGVGRLVCTHLLPGADEDEVHAEATSAYRGEVVVGRDLMRLDV